MFTEKIASPWQKSPRSAKIPAFMRIPLLVTVSLAVICSVVYQMESDSTAVTSSLANLVFRNNLHEVVPGKFFRSAQMARSELAAVIEKHGIKSVIDLRLDEDAPDKTGATEAQTAASHGAEYRHIGFSSSKAAQRPSILALLKAYDEMPLPILVHCSSGTHRSGVASALWLLDKEMSTPEIALEQLSFRFGYFQVERDLKAWRTGRPTLDRVVSEYAKVAHANGAPPLRRWLSSSAMLEPSKDDNTRND